MNLRTVLRLVGVLVMFIGLSMSFSLLWSLYLDEPDVGALAMSMLICLGAGGGLFALGWGSQAPIMRREGMAMVGLSWLLAALFGALPFYLSGATPNFADAYFEAMSGFTTTGSTVLTDIEALPKGVLFWRSFTHWLGGMGIVVLFVAILPYLRVSGKQLFKSEVPGPTAEVLRPRISETASVLWRIYVGLTLILVVILWLLGLSLYEALCHTFGTMATGGFSVWNKSIGYYNSVVVDIVIVVFMILAGTNFGLYFQIIKGDWKTFWRNSEWRFFMGIIGVSTAIISIDLIFRQTYGTVFQAIRYAGFQVVSIITTTGYGTADFETWSSFSQMVLIALMFVGGCAGSTGGGMKVVRILVVLKQAYLGMEKVFRPHLVRTLKIGGIPVEDDVRDSILIFFVISLHVVLFGSLAIAAMGVDVVTAVTAVIATLNNIGPGLGLVGPVDNFSSIPDAGKYLLSLCMVLGRLELFAVLVLFMPAFWRGH
ncbi:MAG: TrkH family potassium uptake protein [Candidatus Latescibacteria bacterium]|jgi:trk system potassium uptake protein|nr:TrkH family potassium uptake protein [Candidatus Latescibacterota bacterium]